jgi:hypothetical protein
MMMMMMMMMMKMMMIIIMMTTKTTTTMMTTILMFSLSLTLLWEMMYTRENFIFLQDVIFLMLGGLIVAMAIEDSNLHKRFTLRLLLLLGVQPRK